jgi:type II secretory pathway pseudopilin PulG
MRRDRKLRNYKINKSQTSQRGYAMLMLMLIVALITIGFLAVLPRMKQQVQRDREEELRHRGNSYMRAIQHFYKKFGRYPSRVEELENTNNLRFIRKLYKDPINRDPATGKEKDFKLLHQMDISLNNGPVLPGQTPGLNGNAGQAGLPGQQGAFGGGAQGGFGGGGFGNSPQGGLGGLGTPSGQPQTPAGQTTPPGDADAADAGAAATSSPGSPASGLATPGSPGSGSPSSSGFNGPMFGGGPILGVASLSKAKSIRVFFDKSHYNDWMFIYIPQADRGGLLVGPINPGMPTGNFGAGLVPGAGGIGGQPQGFGQGLGQGQGQGFGQTPNGGLQNPPGQGLQNPGQTPQQ